MVNIYLHTSPVYAVKRCYHCTTPHVGDYVDMHGMVIQHIIFVIYYGGAAHLAYAFSSNELQYSFRSSDVM